MNTQLADAIKYIQTLVNAGYDNRDTIIENGTGYLEDCNLDKKWINTFISHTTDQLLGNHWKEQSTWNGTTDVDRLDQAFKSMEERGILARQNFTCCSPCGVSEISDEIDKIEKLRPIRGYVFFHSQDTESAVEDGFLHLNFGASDGDGEATKEIGREVCETLMACGLSVEWDGSAKTRIMIPRIDWKKRRMFM